MNVSTGASGLQRVSLHVPFSQQLSRTLLVQVLNPVIFFRLYTIVHRSKCSKKPLAHANLT
jgi:hypothetical protein